MIYQPRHGSHDLVSVDLFAGGGGASEGIRLALGQAPAVAINHDPAAIKIRALADVAIPWAREVRPRVIILENVIEWLGWGPLYPDDHPGVGLRNKPIPERKGEHFDAWRLKLEALGYVVEWRQLVAADYGAPTTRKRLFLVARCDGRPIVWPEPSHGPGRPLPWRAAAECIDWSFPTLSLWATKEEQRAWQKATGSGRPRRPRRPLADKTLARIARGIKRYVLDDPDPFLVPQQAIAPVLIHSGNGERKGQAPRVYDIRNPLGTVVACGQRHALVTAFLSKHNLGATGQPLREPMHTVMGVDQKALTVAHLIHHRGQSIGRSVKRPTPTITPTGQGHLGIVATHLTKFYGTSTGSDLRDPAPATTSQGNHAGLVAALLCKYYGNDKHGQGIREPMHTIPTVDRFGLVTVVIDGETYGIVDIGMRMLQPRELATAQGFGPEYILTGTKKDKVGRIGNSASPQPARALVEAQFFGGPRYGQLGLFARAA